MITWVTGTILFMWQLPCDGQLICDLDWFINVSMWPGLVCQCFYVTWTGLSMFLCDVDWFSNVSMWLGLVYQCFCDLDWFINVSMWLGLVYQCFYVTPPKSSIHNKEFNALNISYWHCNSQCFLLYYWTMFHVAVFIIWYVTIIVLRMWHTHWYQILQPKFSLWSC